MIVTRRNPKYSGNTGSRVSTGNYRPSGYGASGVAPFIGSGYDAVEYFTAGTKYSPELYRQYYTKAATLPSMQDWRTDVNWYILGRDYHGNAIQKKNAPKKFGPGYSNTELQKGTKFRRNIQSSKRNNTIRPLYRRRYTRKRWPKQSNRCFCPHRKCCKVHRNSIQRIQSSQSRTFPLDKYSGYKNRSKRS